MLHADLAFFPLYRYYPASWRSQTAHRLCGPVIPSQTASYDALPRARTGLPELAPRFPFPPRRGPGGRINTEPSSWFDCCARSRAPCPKANRPRAGCRDRAAFAPELHHCCCLNTSSYVALRLEVAVRWEAYISVKLRPPLTTRKHGIQPPFCLR
jgi:hypothetical protein